MEDLICTICGEPLDDCCNDISLICCACEEAASLEYDADGEEELLECDSCGEPVEVEGLCENCAEGEDAP